MALLDDPDLQDSEDWLWKGKERGVDPPLPPRGAPFDLRNDVFFPQIAHCPTEMEMNPNHSSFWSYGMPALQESAGYIVPKRLWCLVAEIVNIEIGEALAQPTCNGSKLISDGGRLLIKDRSGGLVHLCLDTETINKFTKTELLVCRWDEFDPARDAAEVMKPSEDVMLLSHRFAFSEINFGMTTEIHAAVGRAVRRHGHEGNVTAEDIAEGMAGLRVTPTDQE